MQLVAKEKEKFEAHALFVGAPLTLAFATGEDIAEVKKGADVLPLIAPFHVSDDDTYLVLPEDIGMEIIDILRDGDSDLLAEAMRDGLLVFGSLERAGKGRMVLAIEHSIVPSEAMRGGLAYGSSVALKGVNEDALASINTLEPVQITVCSSLVDEEGLEQMLGAPEFVGTSWRAPARLRKHGAAVDPTFVWSKRLPDGRVGVELALFTEYEEVVALLRPVVLSPA
jgi:hypothetical protein